MRQGADRGALKDRKDDLYETPACAIKTLIRHVNLPEHIWEPCAGRGAISRELLSAGHFVAAQDLVAYPGADFGIEIGIDFLMERQPPWPNSLIVTNVPYKLADQFIRHAIDLGCDMWVLLRLMAIEGANRSDIVDHHLVEVLAGIERLPMMHREGWEGKRNSNSGAPFGWFYFSALLTDGPISLRRVSWRSE